MTLSLRFSRPEVPDARPVRSADELTGLASRAVLRDVLADLVAAAAPGQLPAAALLIDLDRFREINHVYGQSAGDDVLRVTARRLGQLGPARPGPFRYVGDQFAVVLERATPDDAVAAARAAFVAVNQPATAADATVPVSASVGIVMIDGDRSPDQILRDAEMTIFATKAAGGRQIYMHSPDLDAWAGARRQELDTLPAEVEQLRAENRLLSEFVHVDPSTGLGSPAAFQADHDQADARRRRSKDPYCLLVVDLDWFFDFGQTYGPAAADQAVLASSGAISAALRPGDRAYRLGEDEFAVLMPGATNSEAVAVAESIRLAVESLALPHSANPWGRLTATVGAVEAGFRHSDNSQVLTEAQAMLRSGKDQGRNRIAWPH